MGDDVAVDEKVLVNTRNMSSEDIADLQQRVNADPDLRDNVFFHP